MFYILLAVNCEKSNYGPWHQYLAWKVLQNLYMEQGSRHITVKIRLPEKGRWISLSMQCQFYFDESNASNHIKTSFYSDYLLNIIKHPS